MNILKISYQIGGLYDLFLGTGILFFRNYLLTFLHQTIPNIPQIVDALGLFLIAYGFLLLDESRKDDLRLNIGLTSAIVRIVFFCIVIFYIMVSKVEILYIIFAVTDLLTGLFIIFGIFTNKRAIK